MRLDGAIVDIEDGVLHIRIPFLRVIENKKIKLGSSPIRYTRREKDVLQGVLELKANKEIACDLHISERTVKYYVSELLKKHEVAGRLQLVDKLRTLEGERR